MSGKWVRDSLVCYTCLAGLLASSGAARGQGQPAPEQPAATPAGDSSPAAPATTSLSPVASPTTGPVPTMTSSTATRTGTTQEGQALVGCNGYSVCFIGGALLASFSLTSMGHPSDRDGSTAHKMVSVAMPMLGFRYVPGWLSGSGLVSVDLLVYTGLIPAQSLDPGPSNVSGCHTSGNTFESLLPCEGNATLTPQFAFAFPALTVTPTPSFSALTVALTYGWARTNHDSAFNPFVGVVVTVGAAQLGVGLGSKSGGT
jgi:hypothetical protein